MGVSFFKGKGLVLFGIILLFSFGIQAQSYRIKGKVISNEDKSPLSFVKVIVVEQNNGAIADLEGDFELTLLKGTYDLQFKLSGYETYQLNLIIDEDKELEVQLVALSGYKELEGVDIYGKAKDENVSGTQIGSIKLDMEEVKTLPAFMGEVDIIKTLQLTPGVQSVGEGTQGFYVRGGGPDQNLVLLDGTHVYNATHLFGFFSIFNVDAVQDIELTKVGMPAEYGGRLSSVLDINLREGSKETFGFRGGLGLISSRLTVEGPIVKQKSSFVVSGRRTYIDVVTKPFIPEDGNFSGSGYYFYDLNARLNYKLSDRDKLIISGYLGKDEFTFATASNDFSVDMPWGNAILSAQWNHRISDKTVMQTRAALTDYMFQFISRQDDFDFGLSSGIRDYSGSWRLTHFASPRVTWKMGVDYIRHQFTPVSVSATQGEVDFNVGEAQRLISHESAVYVSNEFNVTEKFAINSGLRYSTYHFMGPFKRFVNDGVGVTDSIVLYDRGELIQFYNFLEPRISARYLLSSTSSLKVGWNYNAQYVHLANLSAVALPTDIWYPATDIAAPQSGWQLAGGYFKNFKENKYETSVEVYYKSMNNLIEFKEGALPQDNTQDNTDNLLTLGEGYSFGAEFFIKKTYGKLTGWLGYTLSKTERRFDAINNGEYFPAKYDRRHDLTAVANYKMSERWTFSASFVYATGNTMTLPVSWYLHDNNVLFEYGDRNATRMPAYHRLDIAATWFDRPTKKLTDKATGEVKEVKKRFRHNFNISVFNVYNRQNPFFLFVQSQGSLAADSFNISLQQVALFPILPSITWNFEF